SSDLEFIWARFEYFSYRFDVVTVGADSIGHGPTVGGFDNDVERGGRMIIPALRFGTGHVAPNPLLVVSLQPWTGHQPTQKEQGAENDHRADDGLFASR